MSTPAREKVPGMQKENNTLEAVGSLSKENLKEDPPTTKTEEAGQGAKEVVVGGQSSPFVRNYRGKNSAAANNGGNGAYRMSMTIRPQTVANLASKFDTIVKDQQPSSKNNRQGGLKLRSYDITKIISELNKLNNEGSEQSCVKSKPKPGKNENHLPRDGSSGGRSGTVGDNRERNLSRGLGGDSTSAKTTASCPQPEPARPSATSTLKKTAEESHNNQTPRQDAVGPVDSCEFLGIGSKTCENSSPGRNGRSRRTSVEERATSSPTSLPTGSSSSTSSSKTSFPPATSSLARGGKEARKGLAVSFSPEEQVSK